MNTFIILFLALLVFALINFLTKRKQTGSYTFESRGEIFTPAERSFYGVLQQAIGDKYAVFGKVRLGDVIQPAKNLSSNQRQSAWNKINRKHIDFLICHKDDLSLVACLELDDKSHKRGDRSQRDEFVDQALGSAGILILRFVAKKAYSVGEIKERLSVTLEPTVEAPNQEAETLIPISSENSGSQIPTPENLSTGSEKAVPETPSRSAPVCPSCDVAMVKRQAKKGPNAGKWFWACPNFPKCRKVVPIED